jgi:hypothetical protein
MFKGELDCTIQVGQSGSALRLVSSSRDLHEPFMTDHPENTDTAFERTLTGTIPGADGGFWEVDLDVRGKIGREYSSYAPGSFTGLVLSLSGSFTTPAGFTVALEESLSSFGDYIGFHHTEYSWERSFDGSFTATLPPQTYRWSDISFYSDWSGSGSPDVSDWHASGTVTGNVGWTGTVGFNGSHPVVAFGAGRYLYLDQPRTELWNPSWPAASPFQR